jgi:hypothetical protein
LIIPFIFRVDELNFDNTGMQTSATKKRSEIYIRSELICFVSVEPHSGRKNLFRTCSEM